MEQAKCELLQKILKDNNYSLTKPRQLVCELLWDQEPLSMRELNNRAAEKIDRASLYRTVALFERLGIVQRIYIGWKYKIELSDIFTHHHHHISCTNCGKIVAITDETKIEQLIHNIARKHGFTPQTHQLEIRGLCTACQKGQPE